MLTKWVDSLSKIITKYDGIITNCDGQLLQIATAFLLHKVNTVYDKFRQGLQNAMIITNCDSSTVLVRKLHNAPDRGRGGSCVVIPGRAPAW